MASSYYDSAGKDVVDGDVAYAADLNDINAATDTGFQLVEAAVDALATNQPYYADLAEKWAENPEDTAVTPGKYSALHWAAKAEDDVVQTAADRVQTGLDKVATAADRVQTGLDKVATAADRVQTGLDRTQTGLDRVQTGLDVTAASGFADDASDFADDSAASAVISAANARGRNYLINGNFDVWQRGTSATASGYLADRWVCGSSGTTKTQSRQSFTIGQSAVPGNPTHYHRTVVSSVAGASNYCLAIQYIEDVRSLSGGKATISFWAKADAPKNIAIELVQSFGTGGSPSAMVTAIGSQLKAITASWNRYTATIDVPSISGKTLGSDGNSTLTIAFWYDAGSSINARTASLGQQSGTFDLSQVQLEEGENATSYERRPLSYETSLCQRYYQTSYQVSAAPGSLTSSGAISISSQGSNNYLGSTLLLPVKMRSNTPACTIYNPLTGTTGTASVDAVAKPATAAPCSTSLSVYLNNQAVTANQFMSYHYTLDAEL